MKIASRYFNDAFEIETPIFYISVENRAALREILSAISGGNEPEVFILSEKFEPVPFKKKAYYISDPLGLFDPDRKVLAKIENDLAIEANQAFSEEVCEVRKSMLDLAEKLSFSFDFDFVFSEEIATQQIIKLLAFRPGDDVDSQIEKIFSNIRIIHKYLGATVFFSYGLALLYENDELEMLYQELLREGVNLIDIEPNQLPEYLSGKRVLIDKDLCVLFDNPA